MSDTKIETFEEKKVLFCCHFAQYVVMYVYTLSESVQDIFRIHVDDREVACDNFLSCIYKSLFRS